MGFIRDEQIWRLQKDLLSHLEAATGDRDITYTICQPRFSDGVPHICVWPDTKEVVAYLSRSAERYWPSLVFELAHESVHLLNPRVGGTNVLEEGVATYFQYHVTPEVCGVRIPITVPAYVEAKAAVEALGVDVIDLARSLRERFGSLGETTADVLAELCPQASSATVARAAAQFQP